MARPWRVDYQAFSQKDRAFILARASHRCELGYQGCTITALIADHVIPDFEGGSNTPDNGQAVCGPCHDIKTKRERARAKAKRSRYRPAPRHPGLL